jgi:hypothetical protein
LKNNRETIVILILAVVWLLLRSAMPAIIGSDSSYTLGVFANLFFLLLAVYWSLRDLYSPGRPEDGNFLTDMKQALRAGSKYVILVTGFIFLTYSYIHKDYLAGKASMQLEAAKEELAKEGALEAVIEANPQLAGKTKEELMEMKTEQIQAFLSPQTQTLFSLVALMFMNMVYSVLIVLLFRKVLYDKHHFAKARNIDLER